MTTLSTLPVPEIHLSLTVRMIRTEAQGACVCQHHWLDLTW